MENNNILEQPPQDLPCHQGVATQQEDNNDGCDSKSVGSKALGKFKDEQALLQAYNNLQSEFTKKCQSLADLTKQLEDNKVTQPTLPSRQQVLEQTFDEFVVSCDKFAPNKQEILSLVDTNCQDATVAIKDAISKFAIDNYSKKQELVNDPDFLEQYVYNNQQIQQKIIQQYFDNITLNQAPNVIASHVGSHSVLAPKSKPKSLQEAGSIVRAMFGE